MIFPFFMFILFREQLTICFHFLFNAIFFSKDEFLKICKKDVFFVFFFPLLQKCDIKVDEFVL